MYEKMDSPAELRVSGKTHPNKLGGAIAKYLKEAPSVRLTAMGDAPIAAAVKGTIVAQSFLAYEAQKLDIEVGFDQRFDRGLDKEVTIVVFFLKLAAR